VLTVGVRVVDSWPTSARKLGNSELKKQSPISLEGLRAAVRGLSVGLIVLVLTQALAAREKDATQYGAGLIVNVPYSEAEILQVIQDVVQSGLIRGTREYNKDEYMSGAEAATSTRAFPEWQEGGKVFYKIRQKAVDPWNFKDTSDVGTVAVRYVVQPQDDKHTILRIDAKFVEDYRHVSHPSNGSVESSEYKDIHDRLEQIELMKAQAAEANRVKQQAPSKPQIPLKDEPKTPAEVSWPNALVADTTPAKTAELEAVANIPSSASLEERVHELRKQVERIVKAPGAPLKMAPFHTASTLKSLSAGSEVLIVISTPYWFGVETHDGQHGWISRDQLEMLP